MTVRVDYDALLVLRAAAQLTATYQQSGIIPQTVQQALVLTDPDRLLAIEAAGVETSDSVS